MSTIHIDRLKPHPKNAEYFADIDGEKYEERKRQPNHTLRIAFTKTPCRQSGRAFVIFNFSLESHQGALLTKATMPRTPLHP